ncbi:beta-N-acetylhexosaminidase [Salipiger mangrovisoli]|uniref:beta-N-acetylhexosaminidase n=1 Tax=Salipiger mangrovisoli TaxID=2865933 RepID=A0ABR9X3Y7_9RHOB|nr:beta-N-acetylhexosaminidase [Salipiger mangrovisoli]MBE9638167.1 beta-N-acetylhexosaminidase [Salipiger mangrovisoli]
MSRFGATILAPLDLRLSAEEKRFFAEANPFGFILFARNVDSAEQLRALTSELRAAVGWHAPVFVDQEGGRVQRLRAPLATEFLPPLDEVARAGAHAAQAMEMRFRIIAAELLAVGIDGNCAPMLDVARPDTHAFLRNRCYAEDVAQVIEIGKAVVKGLSDGGVLPVMKHLPGHGLAQLDSHKDLPRVSAPREELEDIDFAAFRPFAELPLAMTAHLVYEGLNTRPATVDPEMVALIRENIGFTGLLMSDDLSMEALSGTIGERSAATVAAGCDVVLHCNGKMEDMVPVVEAAGMMTEAAQGRAEAALSARTIPAEIDIAALRAEHEALLAGPR